MKVSIITSVYSNREMIAEAIESVLSQTYDDIEYIIVDGGSTDGTVEIIRKYEDKITTFVSEPDKGIYDGLNKGIGLATGDIVGFLHSDDLYENAEVIAKVVQLFESGGCDSLYGDLVYVNKEDTSKVFRHWKSGEFTPLKLKRGWMPPHPTFFVKREVYERYGVFDLNFRIAADYDFMLRVLGKHGISTCYLPVVLYKMRVGGESNKSVRNIMRKSKEDLKALKNNKVGGASTLLMKNLSKIPQFFTK